MLAVRSSFDTLTGKTGGTFLLKTLRLTANGANSSLLVLAKLSSMAVP